MDESICLIEKVDKGTELFNTHNGYSVNFTNLSFTYKIRDDSFSTVNGILITRENLNKTFFININCDTSLSDNLVNSFATFTDDNLDLVNRNLNAINLRCCWCQFWTWLSDC